jgi:hypothetical protein
LQTLWGAERFREAAERMRGEGDFDWHRDVIGGSIVTLSVGGVVGAAVFAGGGFLLNVHGWWLVLLALVGSVVGMVLVTWLTVITDSLWGSLTAQMEIIYSGLLAAIALFLDLIPPSVKLAPILLVFIGSLLDLLAS